MADDDRSGVDIFDIARVRVEVEPALMPYRDTILHPGTDDDEHWAWVAVAPVEEILDWVKSVTEAREEQM